MSMQKLQASENFGKRYFATREEAEADLEKKRAADKAKHSKWDVYHYEGPDGEEVWGSTGGSAVLGWQIAVDAGWKASKANGKESPKQKNAEEQLESMTQEQRDALLLKYISPEHLAKLRSEPTAPA